MNLAKYIQIMNYCEEQIKMLDEIQDPSPGVYLAKVQFIKIIINCQEIIDKGTGSDKPKSLSDFMTALEGEETKFSRKEVQ